MHRLARTFSSQRNLETVWKEASVRVVRADDASVIQLMREFETVHEGQEGSATVGRSWRSRLCGSHRFTLLLEHQKIPLAYMLVSVSPVVARSMRSIFFDEWPRQASAAYVPQSNGVVDALGHWSHCNFYSINSVNRSPQHPFASIPVGPACIAKSAHLIRSVGVRQCLLDRHRFASGRPQATSFVASDALDANNEMQQDKVYKARLYTMSPVPGLASYVEKQRPTLWQTLQKDLSSTSLDVAANKEELLALAKECIDKKIDPVSKFHTGNGAKLFQLNWMADPSPKRMQQSFGIMCNYDYNDVKKE